MSDMRWRLISLITWLTLFFNIERIDIDIDNIDNINLPTSVYIVGVFVTIAALLPFFQRHSVWALITTGIAMYIGVLVLSRKPILNDVHLYLTLTGVFMLVITAILSYNLGRSLEEFIAAVSEMTFSNKGGRLRTVAEAEAFVDLEMASSRRTQRPLSLVLFQGDASSMNMTMHRLIQEIQRSMMQRYLMATIARVLSRYIRRTDIIIEAQQAGRLVLLAPETNASEAELLGERLKLLAQEKLGVTASYSVSTFPDQALTYEDMINVAEQRLNEQPLVVVGLQDAEDQLEARAEQSVQEAIGAPVTAQPEA